MSHFPLKFYLCHPIKPILIGNSILHFLLSASQIQKQAVPLPYLNHSTCIKDNFRSICIPWVTIALQVHSWGQKNKDRLHQKGDFVYFFGQQNLKAAGGLKYCNWSHEDNLESWKQRGWSRRHLKLHSIHCIALCNLTVIAVDMRYVLTLFEYIRLQRNLSKKQLSNEDT